MSTQPPGTVRDEAADALEAVIGRVLVAGTWTAMALVFAGVLLMVLTGVDPQRHGGIPPFHPAAIPADLLALRPAGFLWAGIILIVLLPVGRVVVAGLGFLGARDGRLGVVSLLVLLVVAASIAAAVGLEA